jgi:hypothetical protein
MVENAAAHCLISPRGSGFGQCISEHLSSCILYLGPVTHRNTRSPARPSRRSLCHGQMRAWRRIWSHPEASGSMDAANPVAEPQAEMQDYQITEQRRRNVLIIICFIIDFH